MTRRLERRAEQARRRALPDAIEFIVLAIRAGHTPLAAVRHARRFAPAALAGAFSEFDHRCERGASFADALSAFTDEVGIDARRFVDALATADRYGLPIGPVLDRLIDDARDHRRLQAAEAARRLPVTMAFPLVTCTLPSFVLLAVIPAVLGAVTALRGSLA